MLFSCYLTIYFYYFYLSAISLIQAMWLLVGNLPKKSLQFEENMHEY